MLEALRSLRFITTTQIREINWGTENTHRVEFVRYLREIPQNFREIAKQGGKRELVRRHLKNLYKDRPKEEDVDIVVERITNLASLLSLGRENVENKAGQNAFKNMNWRLCERCQLCGVEFLDVNQVTLDHIIPLTLGGAEKQDNWQLTCFLCNAQKRRFWGIADLSRSVSMGDYDGSFFNLPVRTVIEHLSKKGNPTRYWVLEREERRCSICTASTDSEKLVVGPREPGFLLTVDNLTTYCRDCAKEEAVLYCE